MDANSKFELGAQYQSYFINHHHLSFLKSPFIFEFTNILVDPLELLTYFELFILFSLKILLIFSDIRDVN